MSIPTPYSAEKSPAAPRPPDPAGVIVEPVSDPNSGLRSAWWLALTAAVVGVVVGVMIVAWPEATLQVVAVLFGLWLLVHGVGRIVQAVAGRGRDAGERAIVGVIGVLFLVAGVLALRNLLASLALIVTLIGLMSLIGGLTELISAFVGPRGSSRTWNVVLGALSIIFGITVLVWPDLSLMTLVYLTGTWMIVAGLLQVGLVVVARRSLAGSLS
jgi:uncharacterized membrane protein HdeD (DUF308 family)